MPSTPAPTLQESSSDSLQALTEGDTLGHQPLNDRFSTFRTKVELGLLPVIRVPLLPREGAAVKGSAVLETPKQKMSPKIIKGSDQLEMHVDETGEITHFVDPKPRWSGTGFIFDINDSILRSLGNQPYRYEQHRLAESTREERILQRQVYDETRGRQAIAELMRLLYATFTQSQPVRQKRKVLFELWDDCAEGASEKLATAGRSAILGFIRTQFPPGSDYAYTHEELCELNQNRSSRELFDPYCGAPATSPRTAPRCRRGRVQTRALRHR